MHLTIFRTSVNTQKEAGKLQPLLAALPVVSACNFDLDDSDNILRIISTELKPPVVFELMKDQGFVCEEMESFVYDL